MQTVIKISLSLKLNFFGLMYSSNLLFLRKVDKNFKKFLSPTLLNNIVY